MKKVNLLSDAEMKNILGGTDPGGGGAVECYDTMDDEICSFIGPGGNDTSGECGYSTNRKECRCIAWDGLSSIQMGKCKKGNPDED